MNNRIASLWIMIALISCVNNTDSSYVFDPKSLKESQLLLSEIGDDVNYIPLSSNLSLNGVIVDFNPMYVNDHFYLYDSYNGILVFNKQGNLLSVIGKKGRGPGEYIYGFRFTVNEESGQIYVNDGSNIKVYSNDGTFQKSFSLEEYGGSIDDIKYFNSGLFISFDLQFADATNEWIIIDTLGKLVKKKYRVYPAFKSNYLIGGGTYIFDGKLNYWNNFLDTIFSISSDFTYRKNFLYKSDDYRLPKYMIKNPFPEMQKFVQVNQIFETNKYIAIRYSFYKGKNGFVLVNKRNFESVLCFWKYDNTGCIINDLDGGLKFLPRSYMVDNGREYLVELVDPLKLINHCKSNEFTNFIPKYPQKKTDLIKLTSDLKETDNPVLMMVRLKK
jgi:hypothetical protein